MKVTMLLLFACLLAGAEPIEYRVQLDKMLSPDPELSVPEVSLAIETRESEKLKITWLLGGCKEARKMSLQYFLRLETENPQVYRDALRSIAAQVEERVKEIDEVAKHPGQVHSLPHSPPAVP